MPTSPFPPIAKDLHCHWGLKAEKNLVEGCLRALKRVSAHKPHQFGHISEELDHMVTGLQPVVPHSPQSSTPHSKIDYVYNNSNKKQLPPCPPQIHYPTIEGFRRQSDPVTDDDARRIRTKLLAMASPLNTPKPTKETLNQFKIKTTVLSILQDTIGSIGLLEDEKSSGRLETTRTTPMEELGNPEVEARSRKVFIVGVRDAEVILASLKTFLMMTSKITFLSLEMCLKLIRRFGRTAAKREAMGLWSLMRRTQLTRLC